MSCEDSSQVPNSVEWIAMTRPTLIFDGFNVMHSMPEFKELESFKFEEARQRFIDIISARYQGVAVTIIIVFDGQLASKRKVNSFLTVMYTAAGTTADNEIISMIKKHPHPRSVTVISSDREIQSLSAHFGSTIQSSSQFQQMSKKRRSRVKSRPQPEPYLSEKDVEDWLAFFKQDKSGKSPKKK